MSPARLDSLLPLSACCLAAALTLSARTASAAERTGGVGSPQAPPTTARAGGSDEVPAVTTSVVVTASRTEEKAEDAPVTVTVVPESELAVTPSRNYADLLRGLPGVNAIQITAQQTELTTRSPVTSAASSQLVLVDGRSVYVDFLGFVQWDALPVNLDEVRQVEVVNGPGSAVWGADAMSGVINLRTKAPSDMAGGWLDVAAGEVGTASVGARWAGVSGRTSYKVSASWYRQDAWERDKVLPSGLPMPPYENQGTSQPKLDLRLDTGSEAGRLWSFRAGVGGMSGISVNAAGVWDVRPGSSFSFADVRTSKGSRDVSLVVDHVRMNAPNRLSDVVNRLRGTAVALDASDRTAVGERHVLVYGASGRVSWCDLGIAPRATGRQQAGAYLQDEVVLAEPVRLVVGARADWFRTTGAVLSPRASLLLSPAGGHVVRLAWGRGYRAPSMVEMYVDLDQKNVLPLPTGPFTVVTHLSGNEDLAVERSDSAELAWNGALGRTVRASAALWAFRRDGAFQVVPTSFYGPGNPPPGWPLPPEYAPAIPATLVQANQGTVLGLGTELSVEVRPANGVVLRGAYTFQNPPRVSTALPGSPLLAARPPRHQGSVVAGVDAGRWFGSAGVSYVDAAWWSDVLDSRFWGPTDAYTLVDAAVGLRFGNGRYVVQLRGTDLADRKVKQHVFGDIVRRKVCVEASVRF